MFDLTGILTLILLAAVIVLLLLLLRRPSGGADGNITLTLGILRDQLEKLDRSMGDEFARARESIQSSGQQDRSELQGALRSTADSLQARLAEIATLQRNQLDSFAQNLTVLTQTMEQRVDRLRESVEGKLSQIQEDNTLQLEKMRMTVDEKLHATLERRLGESFRIVSESLEKVQLGLGEMKSLATGVGDLKRVLTNVKSRGTWGEVQLGALLEQVLTQDQYATNIATKPGSADRVEFAIKLPGRDEHALQPVWLPVDAKFPQEDYQRLLDAQDQANPALVEESGRQMENRVKMEARSIHEKYVDPPYTTDFAVMFLPTEGLYAEVLRRPGLADWIQREFKILVTGPTTLAALLNSLQLGFRTLAIEKRSSEVWTLLGAVKTEFGKFGDVLEKTQKKLQEASNTIDDAGRRTRAIARKLKDVQELPAGEAVHLLGRADDAGEEPDGGGNEAGA